MKMLKNGLEADAFATSRIPIPSPPSTKRGDVRRCAARPPARLAHDPHAVAVAVAVVVVVAEPVDEDTGLRKTEQKRYKNRGLPSTVPKKKKCAVVVDTQWLGNANAPRLDDPRVDVASRVGLCRTLSLSNKASSC